jgi:hypothetical protein
MITSNLPGLKMHKFVAPSRNAPWARRPVRTAVGKRAISSVASVCSRGSFASLDDSRLGIHAVRCGDRGFSPGHILLS